MKLKIEQRHIEKARYLIKGHDGSVSYRETHCPVALALKEKTHKKVCVHRTSVIYNGYKSEVNNVAQTFIDIFDNEGLFRQKRLAVPCTLELNFKRMS